MINKFHSSGFGYRLLGEGFLKHMKGDPDRPFFNVPTRDMIKKVLEEETGVEPTTYPGELPKMLELGLQEFKGRPVNLSHDERKVGIIILYYINSDRKGF